MSDEGIADDELRMLMSRASPRRLHQCTDARNALPELPLLPFLGTLGAASRRDGSLSKALQHYEIRHDLCAAGHPETERVWVHQNCHTDFRWLFTNPALSAEC